MQNDQIYSDIVSSITLKDDINILNNELDLIEKSSYEVNDNPDSVLKAALSAKVYSLFSKLLETEKKEEVVKKIRAKLAEIEIVELTLNSEPKEKTIEAISLWLSKKISQNTAIDIKIDQKIMGGAIIVFKGKYFDGTLRNSFENILKNYV